MTQKIVNDSVKLNDVLSESTVITNKDLLDEQYHGEITFVFKNGMMVYMYKKQGFKLG